MGLDCPSTQAVSLGCDRSPPWGSGTADLIRQSLREIGNFVYTSSIDTRRPTMAKVAGFHPAPANAHYVPLPLQCSKVRIFVESLSV